MTNITEWVNITVNVRGLDTLRKTIEREIDDNELTEMSLHADFDWHDDMGNVYSCYCRYTDLYVDDEDLAPEDRRCEFTLTHSTDMAEYTFVVTTKLKRDEYVTDEEIYYEVMDDFDLENIEVADIYLHLN